MHSAPGVPAAAWKNCMQEPSTHTAKPTALYKCHLVAPPAVAATGIPKTGLPRVLLYTIFKKTSFFLRFPSSSMTFKWSVPFVPSAAQSTHAPITMMSLLLLPPPHCLHPQALS